MDEPVSHGQTRWQRVVAPAALAAYGVAAILFAFFCWPADQARADATISNCSRDGVQAALAVGGLVLFSCGSNPAPIAITATLIVTQSVTLNGANLITLDGGGSQRIISLTAGSALTLTNITLRNGNALDGQGGGAVRVPGSARLLSLNAVFANNLALAGANPGGGAIFADLGSSLVISGSTIVSNAAGTWGGGVYALAPVTISGSTIATNTAGFGGGVNSGGFPGTMATISNTRFVSNTATTSGGGIYATTATIAGSTFERNRAAVSGGGVAASLQVTITGTTIMSNSARFGGGVLSFDAASISGSMFISNTARDEGGAIHAISAAINGATIQANSVLTHGGGVYVTTATIANSIVLSNSAPGGNGGGVAAINVVTVTNSTLQGNNAQSAGGVGTTIAFLTGTSIVSNSASSIVGGVLAAGLGHIVNSTVMSNTAGQQAGGIGSEGVVIVSASTLAGNRSISSAGGAMAALTVSVANSTVAGNDAATGGGAVFFGRSLVMTNATVVNNGTKAISGTSTTVPYSLTNSIIGGPVPTCSHSPSGGSTNVLSDFGCFPPGAHFLESPVNIGSLQDNGGPTPTIAPLVGSAAIGSAGSCLPTDQRGLTRVLPCDIGAYETGIKPTLTSLSPSTAVALSPGFTLTLTGTGFISGTVALWNGIPRPTAVASPTTLLVAISPADLTASGPVTVAARYGGANDSLSNALLFTVTAAPQSITFPQPPDRTLPAVPFTITATASSGLPVAFSAGGPCSVAGSTVTVLGIGTCSITATQTGNASYAAATPVVRSFAISQGSQTITFDPLPNRSLTSGTFQVAATSSSGLPVSFSASGACTVSGTTVTLTGVGTCTITASQPGNGAIAPATPVVRSFQVTSAVVTLPAVGKNTTG